MILLRPAGPALEKLGWAETAGAMEAEGAEDWGEWDEADADGLSAIPWEQPAKNRVEGRTSKYGSKARAGKEVFERYEMRWASLDHSRGSEMAKTRPLVIVSLNELNARLQTVTICPLTSRLHRHGDADSRFNAEDSRRTSPSIRSGRSARLAWGRRSVLLRRARRP